MASAQLGTATRIAPSAGCLPSSATTPSNALGSPLDRSCRWTNLMAAREVGANILSPSLVSSSTSARGVAHLLIWTVQN